MLTTLCNGSSAQCRNDRPKRERFLPRCSRGSLQRFRDFGHWRLLASEPYLVCALIFGHSRCFAFFAIFAGSNVFGAALMFLLFLQWSCVHALPSPFWNNVSATQHGESDIAPTWH